MELLSIHQIISKMIQIPKGILAADESTPTIERRFAAFGIDCTPETRRFYRELLFTAPDIEKYLSGVILFEETLDQQTIDGVYFAEFLLNRGILPGIKVDQGTQFLVPGSEEKITKGLDDLAERLSVYKSKGAFFTKWRAVISIGKDMPTERCILENASFLAKYAKIVQEFQMVPIIEPEVLMDGDHDIQRCAQVTYKTLKTVFQEIEREKVDLTGIILKPNMVLPGKVSNEQTSSDEIAKATLSCLKSVVPSEVPGIMFLSGGQDSNQAIENLAKMNKEKNLPWRLSFSYSRALQFPVMETWRGLEENVKSAQEVFVNILKKASDASIGVWGAKG
ncbi:MAG: fructose-bisphosphate aldolase class I [Patescibacteria group bacterium]|nr:fructose-bisphosphate aldolase class I [Patescibacteria group bacterium]